MPKLLSHYCDGSRHDFRTAAQKIAAQAEEAYTIYTDWPLELEYYLRQYGSFRVQLWGRGVKDSLSPAYVVLASNAFVSLLNVPGYKCDLIEQIVTRRFDEQTHTIRIYKITLQ
jgi:hypothetical protein